MNKSYSKIRHIQESNQRLEKRILNSKLGDVKPMVSEQPNFGFDVLDMELPNQDKMRNLFLSKDDDIPELKGMSDEVKKVMNACVSENNLYKVKGFLDGIETKKMNFLNTIMANLFDNKLGGKSIGQEFNEFQKCVSKKIGGKLNTLLPNKSISEQVLPGVTINQMLQGKEFPGLTKQEQGDTVYYSLLDGQKRKWFVSFRPSNNWIETKIASTNPQFFEKIKSLFSSLKSFKDIGNSAGLEEDIDLVYGIKQTSVDKDEIIKIFDTLVNQNEKEPTTGKIG
jgi:hypothetical protein